MLPPTNVVVNRKKAWHRNAMTEASKQVTVRLTADMLKKIESHRVALCSSIAGATFSQSDAIRMLLVAALDKGKKR